MKSPSALNVKFARQRMARLAMAGATAGLLAVALPGCGKPTDSGLLPVTATSLGTRLDAVQLSGFVNNQEQMDKAVTLASAVPGVHRVSNEMKIKQ
jgi:hypothetical protein